MTPTDLSDVNAHTYTYLLNGTTPAGHWTGLFRPGEKVLLRLINGSAMTYFDVRIPGLKLTVVAVDGQYVHPVTVDELRIALAETYDVLIQPHGQDALCNLCPGHGPHRLRLRHPRRASRLTRPPAGIGPASSPDNAGHGTRDDA